MNTNSNIHISINGADAAGKEVVANTISQALSNNGFTNVALVNGAGEPTSASDLPSIVDGMRSRNADFFNTPITVETATAQPAPVVEELAEA